MRAHELLALSRYDVAKKIRDQVEPGDYDVDVEVRVHGTIRVGEDHEAEVTAAIPWQRVCAVLLDKLNDVTIESVLSEALGDVDDTEVKAQAAAAMRALKGSTTKTVKGAVTTKLAHDELEGD
jgi:hypothetical protein